MPLGGQARISARSWRPRASQGRVMLDLQREVEAPAEWVSAPIEMMSTPFAPRGDVVEGHAAAASRRARPADQATASARTSTATCCRAGSRRRPPRAPLDLRQRVGLHLELRAGRVRPGAGAPPRRPPATRDVVVLDQDARRTRPIRWFWPPPQATAYFSSRRSPGVVLRVSRIAAPRAGDRLDVAARSAWRCRTGAPTRLSAMRSPVSTARARPSSARQPPRHSPTARALGSSGLERARRGRAGRRPARPAAARRPRPAP